MSQRSTNRQSFKILPTISRWKGAQLWITQDWSANGGRRKVQVLLVLFRTAQLARMPFTEPSSPLSRIVSGVYLFVSDFLLGIDLPVRTRVGAGLRIEHTMGIVVNARSQLGRSVTLLHGATIGVADGSRPGTPIIGDQAEICAHAVVVGDIEIGRGAIIGANSVVTRDIPELAVVMGVPGKVKRVRGESDLHELSGKLVCRTTS